MVVRSAPMRRYIQQAMIHDEPQTPFLSAIEDAAELAQRTRHFYLDLKPETAVSEGGRDPRENSVSSCILRASTWFGPPSLH